MRINRYIAAATGISRRDADKAIANGRVKINNMTATVGKQVAEDDIVTLGGKKVEISQSLLTIILNKPIGYICSRDGQGGKTIYNLIPNQYHGLKPVGRLDKDSSGLILLTNDGKLANSLSHPSFSKIKNYEVRLNKPLNKSAFDEITREGVDIGDRRLSHMGLSPISRQSHKAGTSDFEETFELNVMLKEGRNRQIRRTFEALGYQVLELHRISFGEYQLKNISVGKYKLI